MPSHPTHVGVITEIPTPYRLPLYERLASHPDVTLEVLFCAREEPDRPWDLSDALARVPHQFMRGWAPKVRTRRNTFVYEVNPEIVSILRRQRYDLLIIGGYSVFAQQMAIAYARATRTPYVLHSESHARKERGGAKQLLKRALLPQVIGAAAGGLAVGTLARQYLESYGLPTERIRILPNTIDVAAYGVIARQARHEAPRIRRELNLPETFILFVGRLAEVKGVHELLAAHSAAGPNVPPLIIAGDGPLAADVRAASSANVRLLGFMQPDRLIELYALADRTVVPSLSEPWGVVVNEALASGSPVVATDAVGAAFDLVREGRDGTIVAAGDVQALAAALVMPLEAHEPGSGPIARWDYEFGVAQFLEAVALATRVA